MKENSKDLGIRSQMNLATVELRFTERPFWKCIQVQVNEHSMICSMRCDSYQDRNFRTRPSADECVWLVRFVNSLDSVESKHLTFISRHGGDEKGVCRMLMTLFVFVSVKQTTLFKIKSSDKLLKIIPTAICEVNYFHTMRTCRWAKFGFNALVLKFNR